MLYDIPERQRRRLHWYGQICGDQFSFCIIYLPFGNLPYMTERSVRLFVLSLCIVLQLFWLFFYIFPGRDGLPILRVKQGGSNRGLHLILDVRQKEYYGTASYAAGLKVLVHDQQTLPLVSQLGFAVSPGTSTFAALKKLRVIDYIV